MENKIFYYARVSGKEQNLDRQIEAFKNLSADEREIICDKESSCFVVLKNINPSKFCSNVPEIKINLEKQCDLW